MPFCSLSLLMAGVATEKPGSHLYPWSVFFTRILSPRSKTTLFICSLKLGVDTEKLSFQKAALNRYGYWILNSWWLDHFSVWLEAPKCPTEKLWSTSTRKVSLATVNDYFATLFFFFSSLNCRSYFFRWASFEIPLAKRKKQSGAICWLFTFPH